MCSTHQRNALLKPRVLFVINYLVTGGAERHLVELVRLGVTNDRFCADVVCLKSPAYTASRGLGGSSDLSAQLEEVGVAIQHGWLRQKYDASAIYQLLWFIAKTQPDVIYTHIGKNELLLTAVAGAVAGVRTVCTVHSTMHTAAGERFSRLQRMLMSRLSVVVGLAPSHRRYLVETEGLDPARTTYIYNGVDERRFHPRRGRRVDLAPALSQRRVIGVVGNLLREKGHHVLLEAMPRVLEQHPDVSVVFAGADLSGGDNVKAALQAQAHNSRLGDHVVFLGYRPDVERVLAGLDVFVLPSLPLRETFSMAVLEAMACGLPVVATNVGSLPEMLSDGEEGFIVEPNDPSALADRLNVVLANNATADAMGRAAR